jgi:hypothetical protein
VASWESNIAGQPAYEEVVQWMVDELVARRFVVIRYG